MTVDLAALAKLASEATPGPWDWKQYDTGTIGDLRKRTNTFRTTSRIIVRIEQLYVFDDPSGLLKDADAAYIAAASPDVVLALVRVALAAKAAVEAFNSFESNVPFLVAINMLRDDLGDLDR